MFPLDISLFLKLNASGVTPAWLIELARFGSQDLPQWLLAGTVGALVVSDANLRRSVWRVLLAMLIAWVIANIGQALIHVPRPFAMGIGTAWLPHGGGSGFPSSHASVAFAFAAAVAMTTQRWMCALSAIGLASLIAWSRVSLGLHFPSDVFAGALIGVACAWLACRVP